jgi:hypothetical protein
MTTLLEQLVVLFPAAELHLLHLAIDVSRSDLDAAIAQLIGWGCDFDPQAPSVASANASSLRSRTLSEQSSRAPMVKHSSVPAAVHSAGAVGRWNSETLASWGCRPWLEL